MTIHDVRADGRPTLGAMREIAATLAEYSPAARDQAKALLAEGLDWYHIFVGIRQAIVASQSEPRSKVPLEHAEHFAEILRQFPVQSRRDEKTPSAVSIRFPDDNVRTRIDKEAAQLGVSRNKWLVNIVLEALAEAEAFRQATRAK